MGWLYKAARSDLERLSDNVERLTALRQKVKELSDFAFASQGGAHEVLEKLLDEQLVQGRKRVHDKLKEALFGENRQRIALDSPHKFNQVMVEALALIDGEIKGEKRKLKNLQDGLDERKGLQPDS